MRTICPSCLSTVVAKAHQSSCPSCKKTLILTELNLDRQSAPHADRSKTIEDADSIRIRTAKGIVFKMTNIDMVTEWVTLGRINRATDSISMSAGPWIPLNDFLPQATAPLYTSKPSRPPLAVTIKSKINRTTSDDWSINPNWISRFAPEPVTNH